MSKSLYVPALAACLLVACAPLSAAPLTALPDSLQPVKLIATGGPEVIRLTIPGVVPGPKGELTATVSKPAASRKVASLPAETGRVLFRLGSPKLPTPFEFELGEADFRNGLATVTFSDIPIGEATLTVAIYDTAGKELGVSDVTTIIEADQTRTLAITVTVPEHPGALAVTVDTVAVYRGAPRASVAEPASLSIPVLPVADDYHSPVWTPLPLSLRAGQRLVLHASGQVNGCLPAGCDEWGSLAPGYGRAAFLGQFVPATGDATVFEIGREREFTVPSAGIVNVGINTPYRPWGNSVAWAGSFQLTVSLR